MIATSLANSEILLFFLSTFVHDFGNDLVNFVQCATADPDGQKRALVIGGGIANFTDVAATFNGIIRALKEKVSSYTFVVLLFVRSFFCCEP